MSGKPIPKGSFFDDCEFWGVFNGEKRWRDLERKRIFTWDSLHGEIEVYNNRGKHLGVLDINGKQIKDAVKGRSIDV